MRRSRIIISEPNENFNENYKREIYDPDTRYKKSISSALAFNDYINSSRKQISKHFLKRKVKAAFEREPIEKTKGFCFNVPFLPTIAMFEPSQPVSRQIQGGQPLQMPRPTQSTSYLNAQKQEQKIVSNSVSGSINPTQEVGKTVIINLNPSTNTGINTNKQTANQNQSKNLFNVNQTVAQSGLDITTSIANLNANQSKNLTNNTQISNTTKIETTQNEPSREIKIELNASGNNTNNSVKKDFKDPRDNKDGHINNVNNPQSIKNPLNYNPQNNINMNNPQAQSYLQNKNVNPEQLKSLLQQQQHNQINIGSTNPSAQPNYEDLIRQQQQLKYKQLLEAYKNDPDKLKKDIGQTEFAKLQNLIIKNMSSLRNKEQQNSGGNNPNTNNNQIQMNQINSMNQFTPSSNLNLQLLQTISNKAQLGNLGNNLNNLGNLTNLNQNIIQNLTKQMLNNRANINYNQKNNTTNYHSNQSTINNNNNVHDNQSSNQD